MRIPPELAHSLAVTVEQGSLDAAARVLHVTQSAVSQRLATLERLTGQVLLVRSRPVRATAAGETVIRYARQVAHLDADAAAHLGLADGARATLPIAVNADSLATWLLEPLVRASVALGVTLDLHREDESRTAELLARGTVVAAVTTRDVPVPGCTVGFLGVMTYRAVAAPDFARTYLPAGATASALERAPVVDFDGTDSLQSQWLSSRGVDPTAPPRHRVPSSSEFARAIALGLGWGMLPAHQRAGRDLTDLGGPELSVPLHWQQWRLHSTHLDQLAREVERAAAGTLTRHAAQEGIAPRPMSTGQLPPAAAAPTSTSASPASVADESP
ncbi:ArgP/LysG family DNA-binding transcriptional regulator [Demequina sp.]|uniref:ArgP/LysG family DNA-binding transcriptional regulator n=1 Tax=Demequina sp. TaxID=2050685 RepID=UPI0025F99962|nr:ArgP/LysG family DNA-binding transcriptional regulator [Demequina sp.]